MSTRILIVEDDVEICQIEADYLKQAGFKVHTAQDGQQALDIFAAHQFDLVVLDLNLPILDGISVCRSLRRDSSIPIIMVTAKTSEIDELLGLEVGADDYLKKPFSPKVLVARVKALLRRPDLKQETGLISVGDIVINLDTRQVTVGRKPAELTATQFNMLSLMASHPGKAFTRDDLISKGYGKTLPPDIFDRTIDSHIKNIRKAVEKNPKKPQYILTVRGHGYKFNHLSSK